MKAYRYWIFLLLMSATSIYAEYTLTPLPTNFVLSYENIDRDDGNPNLGLFGINMNFDLYHGFYAGPSLYGAASGDLGGLFVIGGDFGYKHSLTSHLSADTGYFIGGGGAHNNQTSDPSGFMSRAHIGLSYLLGPLEFGIQYVKMNYPDYHINNDHWAFTISIPGNLLVGDPSYQGESVNSLSEIFSNSGINFYRMFFGLYQESYYLEQSTDTQGQALNDTMQLMGIHGGVFLSPTIYFGISTAGAYDSSKDGYMDFFTFLGCRSYFNQTFFYQLQAAIGAGGGGNTNTGSGFMYKPSLGLGYAFTKALSLMLEGGYIRATSGEFQGPFTALNIDYQFYNAGPETFTSNLGNGVYSFAGWSIGGQTETYHAPQRTPNHVVENIDLAVIELRRAINPYFFIEGQGAGAYGGNAGSYASGMLGPGLQSPVFCRVRLISDILIGAAGGGGIDVGRGAIYQPEVGLSIDINPYFSLTAKAGRIKAFDGDLDSTTYNLGFIFNFSSLEEGV